MTTLTLFNNITAAATSFPFRAKAGDSLRATGLAGAEVINLLVQVGTQFRAATDSTGAAVTLTATKPDMTFNADAHYQLTKASTAGGVTVQKS